MSDSLHPLAALVLYGHRPYESSPVRSMVVSVHGITSGPQDEAVLDAGRPLTDIERQSLIDTLTDPAATARARSSVALLPATLLRTTADSLTWYRPSTRTILHWRTSEGRTSQSVVLPALVLHVQAGVLHVAAYCEDGRPSEQTPLFDAPLGNVFADSHVCVGSATLPTAWQPEDMAGWEDVLWRSNWSHINHHHTLAKSTTTEQLIAFWSKRHARKTPPSARLLHPRRQTLGQWLAEIAA
jgi:PRTRC genetic system protein B